MKHSLNIFIIILLFVILVFSLGYFPSNREHKVFGLVAKTVNPEIKAGDNLQLQIDVPYVNEINGSILEYQFSKDGLIFYEAKERIYQKSFIKEFPTSDSYELGLYQIYLTFYHDDLPVTVIVPFQVMGRVYWIPYFLVFIIVLVAIHFSLRRFQNMYFHIDKDAYRAFYRMKDQLLTRNYHEASIVICELEEIYNELNSRPLQHNEKERLKKMLIDSKNKVRSLKIKFYQNEFNKQCDDVMQGKNIDFSHLEAIWKILRHELTGEKQKEIDTRFSKLRGLPNQMRV
jgi:hypothetical protein